MLSLMEDAPITPAPAEHLVNARLRDHTLGTRSLGRGRGRHLQGLVLQGDKSATKVWEDAHGKQRKMKLERNAGAGS